MNRGARDRALSILPLIAFLATTASMGHYVIDDSYISFRYARNLVDGSGLVFNPGERVEGYTNFLWIILIAAGIRLGFAPDVFALFLGCLAGLLTVASTRMLCAVFSRRRTSTFAAAMLACGTPFAFWALSGMETVAFTALVTLGILCIVRSTEPAFVAASALAMALACLMRPDGAIFLGVTLAAAFAAPGADRGHRAITAFAVAAAVLAPYLAWKQWYYGDLIPNTFYAKVGGTVQQVERGLRYVGNFMIFASAAGLLPAALLGLSSDWRVRALGAAVTLQILYVVLVGGDSFLFYRFLIPVIPLLCALAALGYERVYDALSSGDRYRLDRVAWGAAAVVLLVSAGYVQQGHFRDTIRDKSSINVRYRQIGSWLKEHSDPTDWIAVIANGIIPFYAERPTLDMLGLTDAHIAHRPMTAMGSGMPGHEKGDGRYVFSKRPRYVLIHPITTSSPVTEEVLARESGRFVSTAELWRMAEFHHDYALHSVKIDEFYFNYFERTSSR